MPTDPSDTTRALPDRPNLRHLKDQAKDLLRDGAAQSLTEAQFRIARLYGFASWPKLKAHVDSLNEIGELRSAIDTHDIDRVKSLMTRNPSLHRAPLGYGKDGPLTWVAECRVPFEPPTPLRLAIAKWMIENGSDVHQGNDGPLMRAALRGDRILMMELLVAHGADVNAVWHGFFPIIFAPCEAVDPVALKWLLDHETDPNCTDANLQAPKIGTALDYVISSYWRSPRLSQCIDLLLDAGGKTRYNVPAALDLLRGRLDDLSARLDAEPHLVELRFPELDFGATGERRLTLKGATLLHVAAEYGNMDAATLLIDRGADVNARAALDDAGIGGQTPIFHAVTQLNDWSLPVAELLMDRGADLSIRAKLPGYYERPDEIVECTPLGYALRFPEGDPDRKTVAALRRRGAIE
jgi:ankyrin repeat protein